LSAQCGVEVSAQVGGPFGGFVGEDRAQVPVACGYSGSPASGTTGVLPACCAICPSSAAESGRIAALKHLR